MEAYDSDEQLEQLKSWWNKYGNALILGILLGVAIAIGINVWTRHRIRQSDAASVLYDAMLQSLAQKNPTAAAQDGLKLVDQYRSTPYAGDAALILARLSLDSGNVDAAREHLQWAVDHATTRAIRDAARLRLGRILMYGGKLDAALALAEIKDRGGFGSDFDELRGDILMAKGQKAAARQAYLAALNEAGADSPYARILQMKLDDVGVEAGK
ncbi:MAG: YfgM family protein [Acidiferrobacterales bacterium]